MADFRTHITASSVAGVAYGIAGYQAGLPWESCLLAGGLCSVSGMLPDLDSNSGIPLRETTLFASTLVPMLMVDRMVRIGMSHELMVLTSAGIYILIRFVIAEFFRRYTVHRGMWHSIPAALSVGMFAFLVMSTEDFSLRLYKTAAVVIGFMVHLILDEIWSIDFRGGHMRFKTSFGTAMKLYSRSRWANVSTYAKLIALGVLVYHDEGFMARYGYDQPDVPHTARQWLERWRNPPPPLEPGPEFPTDLLPGQLGPGSDLAFPGSPQPGSPPAGSSFQPIPAGSASSGWPNPPPTNASGPRMVEQPLVPMGRW
jgi:hypothetical protein